MNPKKSLLAVALAMTMNQGIAEAAPIVNYSFLGTFTMCTPSGAVMGGVSPGDPAVTGTMTMDLGTGTGSASISPSMAFGGDWWTVHSITLSTVGPGTVRADMMIDWGYGPTIPIVPVMVDFGMTPMAPCSEIGCYAVGNSFAMATLDGNGDGIPGYPQTAAPNPGYNAAFNGTLTVTSVVPVPAAVWLFGSGLLGLLGFSRRGRVVATQRGTCGS
jgi:hypothetical protein